MEDIISSAIPYRSNIYLACLTLQKKLLTYPTEAISGLPHLTGAASGLPHLTETASVLPRLTKAASGLPQFTEAAAGLLHLGEDTLA